MLSSLRNRPAYPWLVVALLWVVALLNYMDRQMLSTMKDAMSIDITELQSAEEFGILMAIFLWIYGCVSPFAGAISDRVNRKWLIVGSIFVWSLVTFLMGVAETLEQLRVLRAGYQRGTLYPCWALLDRRLPRGEEPLTRRRDTHDGTLYGAGYRGLRRYPCLGLQLAHDLLYLRYGGDGLCPSPHPTTARTPKGGQERRSKGWSAELHP